MSRREELIKIVSCRIADTIIRIDLEHQRKPTAKELAEDVVDFLHGVATDETKIEEETKESTEASEQDTSG